jgi:hypothetical protein
MPEIPFRTGLSADTLPLRTHNGTEHKVSTHPRAGQTFSPHKYGAKSGTRIGAPTPRRRAWHSPASHSPRPGCGNRHPPAPESPCEGITAHWMIRVPFEQGQDFLPSWRPPCASSSPSPLSSSFLSESASPAAPG